MYPVHRKAQRLGQRRTGEQGALLVLAGELLAATEAAEAEAEVVPVDGLCAIVVVLLLE